MFTKNISNVMTRPSSDEGIGYQYVIHRYAFCGFTYLRREEILALAA